MHTPLDILILLIVIVTQLFLNRRLIREASRRLTPAAARRFTGLWVAVNAVLIVCFALGFSVLLNRFQLPAALSEIAGGIAQLWYFGSTASYLAFSLFSLLRARSNEKQFSSERRQLLNLTGAALLAAPFVAVAYGTFVERLRWGVREVEIPIPELPAGLDGLRMVQLSDIHLSAFLSERDLARIVDAANELHPHLMLVTGDLITAWGDPLDACLNQLARLRADAGILGCLGNHEYYARVEDYTEREGARRGIQFLRHANRQLRFGESCLNIAGVDYQRTSRQYLAGARGLARVDSFNVLLSHNPDVFPVAVQKGFELTLAGHTHGGQVTVEILNQSINPARFVTPYVYGLYRDGAGVAYVTRGIGTIGIPTRLGAPPEIASIRLRKA